jgi:hypothetical protein
MDLYSGKVKDYSAVLMELSRKTIESTLKSKKSKKEMGKVIRNVLIDDGPKVANGIKTTDKELFVHNNLFKPFSEIASSFESIQNIPIYLSTFPYKKKGVSRCGYLKYHVENYLHETYILEMRLLTYLRILKRKYGNEKSGDLIKNELEKLEKFVRGSFKNLDTTRGSHVHARRFSDEEIDRLSTIETLSNSEDEQFVGIINLIYDDAYKKARKKWTKTIDDNSASILKLLDIYFGILHKLFIKRGKFILPSI